MSDTCFECSAPAEYQHHVIPRSKGGTKTVPLCAHCHALVHGMKRDPLHISELTKAGFEKAKARGVKLGSARPGHWDGIEHMRLAALVKAREASIKSKRKAMMDEYADIAPRVLELRASGLGLQAIANRLTESGHKTRRGGTYTATTIKRIISRYHSSA